MKYANWLAELIKADAVPPVPQDPDAAALIAAKAAKFGQAPPGYWDSDSLHATPQRHHIGTFRRLLRDELMSVADQAVRPPCIYDSTWRGDLTPSTRSLHKYIATHRPRTMWKRVLPKKPGRVGDVEAGSRRRHP